MTSRSEAEAALQQIIENYNHVRLNSSLGFVPSAVFYRGNPAAIDEARKQKRIQTRHHRKE